MIIILFSEVRIFKAHSLSNFQVYNIVKDNSKNVFGSENTLAT